MNELEIHDPSGKFPSLMIRWKRGRLSEQSFENVRQSVMKARETGVMVVDDDVEVAQLIDGVWKPIFPEQPKPSYSMLKLSREKSGEIPKIVEAKGLQVTINSTDEECECFAEALGWPASVLKDARDRMKAASDKMLFKLQELPTEAFYSEAFMQAISEGEIAELDIDKVAKAFRVPEDNPQEPKAKNWREWT